MTWERMRESSRGNWISIDDRESVWVSGGGEREGGRREWSGVEWEVSGTARQPVSSSEDRHREESATTTVITVIDNKRNIIMILRALDLDLGKMPHLNGNTCAVR